MRKPLFVIVTTLLVVQMPLVSLNAQEQSLWGVVGGAGYTIHDASFTRLGTYPSCCPSFTAGNGFSLHGGAFYTWRLTNRLGFSGRVVIAGEGGQFVYDENTVVADLRDTLKVVRATFRHELDASILSVGLEPVVTYQLGKVIDLIGGLRLSGNVVKSFRQTETLATPEDYGAYLGGDRTWVSTEAEIPSASPVRLSALTGLRFNFRRPQPSVRGIGLELVYAHALNDVISESPWKVNQLRASLIVQFAVNKIQVEPNDSAILSPKIVVNDSIAALEQAPRRSSPVNIDQPWKISIRGLNSQDSSKPLLSIQERTRRIVVLHPMLGHVYFDEGSSTLSERYVTAIQKAMRDTLGLLPLEALQGELGIIAQRMQQHPDAWLSVVGTTSTTRKDDGLALAKSRAEEVRKTLNRLGIPDTRLRLGSRLYPERPTTFSDTAMKRLAQDENQRVELWSNNPAILAPIKLGTREKVYDPQMLSISASSSDSRDTSMYTVRLYRGTTLLSDHSTRVDARRTDHTYEPGEAMQQGLGDSLRVELIAVTQGRESVVVQKVLPIRASEQELTKTLRSGDIEVERYGLILFDFDDVKVNKHHERQLTFIRSRIRENTTISVIGATDQIGSVEYNRELSYKRAREVARRLGYPNVLIVGSGEDNPAFPNYLPEGRASNRTVVIELSTPVR